MSSSDSANCERDGETDIHGLPGGVPVRVGGSAPADRHQARQSRRLDSLFMIYMCEGFVNEKRSLAYRAGFLNVSTRVASLSFSHFSQQGFQHFKNLH